MTDKLRPTPPDADDARSPDPPDAPSDDARQFRTHQIRSELTLLHGHNQLLLRRLNHGRSYSDEELRRHADTTARALIALRNLLRDDLA